MTAKHKILSALSMTTIGLFFSAPSSMASPFDRDDFTRAELASVKISMEQAIAKAKELYGGTPIKVKMEHDSGTILYEIEMLNGHRETEVLIDAFTGEVFRDD